MRLDESELVFETITEADIPELTQVMTRAFDDDAQKHLGQERGGPPGYDNGEFFRQWLFGYDQTDGYKVLRAGRVIGGVIVWILPDGHNVLGTIFVDLDAQDQSVGTRIWQFIEARYGETKSWRLTTPRWATKNHHFSEISPRAVAAAQCPAPVRLPWLWRLRGQKIGHWHTNTRGNRG